MPCFRSIAKLLFPAFMALALLWPAAHGMAADKAQVPDEINAFADDIINSITEFAAAKGWETIPHGKALVENGGSYYAVTLPNLSFKNPAGQTIEAGVISLNVLTGDRQGEWKVTAALPSPITLTDAAGKKLVTLSLGPQHFTGVYDKALGGFSRADAQYQTVRLLFGQTSAVLTAGNVAIGKSGAQYAPDRLKALKDRIGGAGKPTPALLAIMAASGAGVAQHGEWTIEMSDAALHLPAMGGEPEKTVTLGGMQAAFVSTSGRDGMATLHVAGGFSKLKVVPAASDLNKSLPAQLNLDVTVSNLPATKIIDQDTRPGLPLQLLTDAGTTAVVRDSSMSNDSYTITADGQEKADAKSPLGMTGTSTVTATGLTKLANAVSGLVRDKNTAPELLPYLEDVQAGLIVMVLAGQPGKDKNGKSAKTFTIETTADGKTLLNGQDADALMQAAPLLGKYAH